MGTSRNGRFAAAPLRMSRAEVHDIQPVLRQIVARVCGLIPKRNKELDEERTLRLMQGCLSSLGALHGWFDFEEACEGSRPRVAAQFEERGRPFGRMAREKAARLLPLTVLDGDSGDEDLPEVPAA